MPRIDKDGRFMKEPAVQLKAEVKVNKLIVTLAVRAGLKPEKVFRKGYARVTFPVMEVAVDW